jgi:hypothetical protein
MPVSQADTATTVASTGTYDVARFGIEGRSVRDGATRCQPPLSANPICERRFRMRESKTLAAQENPHRPRACVRSATKW